MKFGHIKTHTIRNKAYRLIWRKPPGKHPDPEMEYQGQCDCPGDKGRELWLWPKQDPLEMLGTAVHEVAHGAFWDLDDEAVAEYERDLLRLLRRMKIKVSFGDG